MRQLKIIHLATGGFIEGYVFRQRVASTRIDESLVYFRDKMTVDPLDARHDIEPHAENDMGQHK